MGTIRITTGKYKGRKIDTPGEGTHPMGERERIALFNMVSENLPGATVMDAYAGSGALGLEALSRGAGNVIFVEKNGTAVRTITENCKMLGVEEDSVRIFRGSVEKFCDEDWALVDMILADPPYDAFDSDDVQVLADKCLKCGGVLVLSHPNEAPDLMGIELVKTRHYAGATVSVYAKL